MENRGRKRKVIGTILAGTFAVPAAMSAVQQNAVNANLFTASINSESNFFAERSLKNFLKVTTYAILPAVIVALLGVLGIYKLYKYFTSTKTSSTKTSAESDYWKVLNSEEKLYKHFFGFLRTYGEKLGIVGTRIEVDSKVLLSVLDETFMSNLKNIKDLLNKKEKVTVSINEISDLGFLSLKIINEDIEDIEDIEDGLPTKYFADDTPGFVNFFNKIFEKSSKQNGNDIKLVLKEKDNELFLGVEGAGANEKDQINFFKDSETDVGEKAKKICELFPDLALVKAFAKDYKKVEYDEINKMLIKKVLENVDLKGKKFKAKVKDLKTVLQKETEQYDEKDKAGINSLGHFIYVCNEKNKEDYDSLECEIENVFDPNVGWCIRFLINDIKSGKDEGETSVWYSTNPLCNDTDALIKFFNMLFEANKDKNGACLKLVKSKKENEKGGVSLVEFNEKGEDQERVLFVENKENLHSVKPRGSEVLGSVNYIKEKLDSDDDCNLSD